MSDAKAARCSLLHAARVHGKGRLDDDGRGCVLLPPLAEEGAD